MRLLITATCLLAASACGDAQDPNLKAFNGLECPTLKYMKDPVCAQLLTTMVREGMSETEAMALLEPETMAALIALSESAEETRRTFEEVKREFEKEN